MDDSLRQAVYLIADEMRGMATLEKRFATDPYIAERAHKMMVLAARLAALVDTAHDEAQTLSAFTNPDLFRASPAVGADAAVFNPQGEILLIRRQGDGTWAMPGGISEIGDTPAETAVKELWEEAGLRGGVRRLLGVFDAQRWGSLSPIHHLSFVFEIECDHLVPAPGLEATEARFFAASDLPAHNMHPSHTRRVPRVFEAWKNGECYFDAPDTNHTNMPDFQRPE